MVMIESFMVALTGWRRERLYRAHSVRLAVAARSLALDYLGTPTVHS